MLCAISETYVYGTIVPSVLNCFKKNFFSKSMQSFFILILFSVSAAVNKRAEAIIVGVSRSASFSGTRHATVLPQKPAFVLAKSRSSRF